MNPGGSVKDRAALGIITQLENSSQLKPGYTVVEGTAGNTGIGLAHVCLSRGYKCVIFMPNTQSQGKIDLLKLLGVEVYPVPVVPFDDPNNYNHQASRHAKQIKTAAWCDQFDNLANKTAHFQTTAPEIYDQLNGNIHGFICATGTGGTFSGISEYLKSKSKDIKCYVADPPGSIIHSYIESNGKVQKREGNSITEGIGQGRITRNLKNCLNLIDGCFRINDQDTINMTYELLHKEGLYLGASSGLNVVAAIKLAQKIGPEKNIVTILCDKASLYQDRLFSAKWLKSKDLFNCIPQNLKKYIVLK